MAKKRKTLPKDFVELLKKGDINELKQVFEKCEIDAYGGYGKHSTISYTECPNELAEWLIGQGLSIETTNEYHYTALQYRSEFRSGNIKSLLLLGANVQVNNSNGTPLHCAARRHVVENVKILLEYGAEVDALEKSSYLSYGPDDGDYTALELTLFSCRNADIEETTEVCKILLQAGANKTPRMLELVTKIGTEFEYCRSRFNKDYVEQTSNALDELYKIFEVAPVPRRILHDTTSPIKVKATTWEKQHEELWELLVPSSGNAQTLQGEVIRIAGRIDTELNGNGGINWDDEYKLMADSFLEFIQMGKKLSLEEINELDKIINEIKRKRAQKVLRMAELGVKWVLSNPQPISLPAIKYSR